MMIALPNKDHSWTVTLFMPFEKFDELSSVQDVVCFFKHYFVDYVQLIGEERLAKLYFQGKPQPLVMVKVRMFAVIITAPYSIGEGGSLQER